jgi:HSP20 family protein
MGSLLPLRSKALLIELLVAIALSGAVIAFSGGITPQSYKNALIVAALVLAPLEALRQSGVLEHLVDLLRERRAQSPRSPSSGGLTTPSEPPGGVVVVRTLPRPPDPSETTADASSIGASNHEKEDLFIHHAPFLAAAAELAERQRRLAQDIGAWAPAMDVIQRDNNLVIRAELPGVDSEDVVIILQNGVLAISGEHNPDDEEEERDEYHLRERRYGPFRRSITLPTNPDKDDLSARFEDGVLEVVIQGAVGGLLPIPGYDEMSAAELSRRLHDLSEKELQLVRDYEERHKKRATLLEQMDRKIRAT